MVIGNNLGKIIFVEVECLYGNDKKSGEDPCGKLNSSGEVEFIFIPLTIGA